MEIDYIKAHMIIERYVQGKLTDDEQAAFEERLVWDRSLQEEVELAEAMRSWMRESAQESRYTISGKARASGWAPRILSQTGAAARVLLQPGYAAAASFALGAFITYSAVQNVGTGSGFGVDETAPSLIVPLLVTRSQSSDLQQIPVSKGGVTVLVVDVPDPSHRFDVRVSSNTGGDPVWVQERLPAGYLEAVAVGIPGDAVPPGLYVLEIASAADGFRQQIPFETVASE